MMTMKLPISAIDEDNIRDKSCESLTWPVILPYTKPGTKNIIVIKTVIPSINGEPEINEPVSAFAKNEFGIKAKTATISIVASNDQFAYLAALISLSDNEPPL